MCKEKSVILPDTKILKFSKLINERNTITVTLKRIPYNQKYNIRVVKNGILIDNDQFSPTVDEVWLMLKFDEIVKSSHKNYLN